MMELKLFGKHKLLQTTEQFVVSVIALNQVLAIFVLFVTGWYYGYTLALNHLPTRKYNFRDISAETLFF